MATPTATTTSCSASRATPTSRRSRRRSGGSRAQLHPDVSEEPDAEARFREVTEAYEVLSNAETRALYDRYGHAGPPLGRLHADALRHRRPRRPVLGVLRRRPVRRRPRAAGARAARTSARRSRSTSSTRRAGRRSPCRSTSRPRARACGGDGVEPGTTPVRVRPLRRRGAAAAGLAQRVRRVRPHVRRARSAADAGRSSSIRARTCDGAGRTLERRELDVEVPAGIHDGQRIRLSGEGHAGALGGRAGDVYVLVRVQARPAVRARGQRHLLAGRPDDRPGRARRDGPGRDARRPGRARVRAGHRSRARCACCADKGMPVLQGFGRGDQRVLVNVSVPRRLNDEQRRLLEEFDADRATSTPTGTTRASSRS